MTNWQRIKRTMRHLLADQRVVARTIPSAAIEAIARAIAASEKRHDGEIRFCIEAGLPWSYLKRNAPARERALMLFSKLRVWDTERNTGVLVYVLMADKRIEIVADRGIDRVVDAARWQAIVAAMSTAFRERRFEDGLNAAIDAVDALLRAHFALAEGADNRNELPDAPVLR